MNLKTRIEIEKRIARRVVRELLAAGYELTVNNGGEYDEIEIPWSRDFTTIVGAMFATDEEYLYARKGKLASFVRFVYGNDGWDVINDYGMSLEPVMAPINQYADAQCERYA
jgi:hypothetical protein